jgi:hypothetical protein
MSEIRSQSGQAAAELVAVVPFLLLMGLAAAQLAIIGFGLWIGGDAARAGARAALFDGGVERVATRAVPDLFQPRATLAGLRVRVELHPPSLLPGVRMPAITASSSLDPEAGSRP